jgi:alpha-beta hydrolase superfamily lysophospholipase
VAGAEHEMLIERDALRQQAMGRALGFLQQAGR